MKQRNGVSCAISQAICTLFPRRAVLAAQNMSAKQSEGVVAAQTPAVEVLTLQDG
ncbi:hypothetical protein DV515_00006259 [Chloebia gouldiae]|uniref:Uncharacterized protein n=1 Tax=Chloebia gouldiae TaxID=44316 RepID=A0A3L8SLP7_CHLGU|nr:hypothetical protein DV515_00006259 [Chloebia gouldiae]